MKKQFFRVKQLADQTFLRADKSEVYNNEELQVAEQRIEYLRTTISGVIKKKKSTENNTTPTYFEHVSKPKTEQGEPQESPTELFSPVIKRCSAVEQDLVREYTDHEKQVEDLVTAPLQSLLDVDYHNIGKHRRNLSKYLLDKDSISNRYQATKKEALKEEMEEADQKVEQTRDALAFEMFSLLAKENDLAGYMLQILKCQRAYHECALKHLKDAIPQLEKQIGDSAVKRVYGIPLQEHLRVTGKRIALPLEICVTLLHRHGLQEEGLFRIVGGMSRVKRLKTSIDSGCFSNNIIPEYLDVHVLASALKMYLRELPDPLLTSTLHAEWMQSMQRPENERLDAVRTLIASLPKENRENLAFLMQFLSELSRHPQNKMSPSNIAIVMAPNLLWDDGEVMNMSNCAATNMLVELFVKEVQSLFPDDVGKLVTFPWCDDDGFLKTAIEFNVSSENVSIAESPKPSSRKKKTPAPGPPAVMSKTDQDFVQNERNAMSASYPSGSSTLNRPQKPKDFHQKCQKTSIGVNTDDRRIGHDDAATHRNHHHFPPHHHHHHHPPPQEVNSKPSGPLVNLDNSKTVGHKVITEPATPVQVSKAKPVQPVIAQNAACDNNKSFKTTITHPVAGSDAAAGVVPVTATATSATTTAQKPVAAPRSIDGVTRSSSIKIELRQDVPEVQLRRPEVVAAKPEVPARPASLQKRPSMDLDPTLHRTQCSVYSVANKQQPSYVNVQNRNEKFQPGHDNQIAEKEKFLHQQQLAPKFGDVNSNSNNSNSVNNNSSSSGGGGGGGRCGLPPKAVKVEKSDASKSNENLGSLSGGEKLNGNNPRTSHVRTRSDGNLIELSDSLMQTPPSPRSLSKPTQPPPPPPVNVGKKEPPDSTDL